MVSFILVYLAIHWFLRLFIDPRLLFLPSLGWLLCRL